MSGYADAARGGDMVDLARSGDVTGGLAIGLVFLAILVACLAAAYVIKRKV
ncbi:hypothetical protein V1L54_24080 [Streptomyces sp. TRM 70361]|uniref:hypothetical protein n=1 Tax=Streptomyces sp. TRM 70361 TaxID=3116553 RepID=UPI002E7BB5F8|nr:hypothetical protein [Streptomyces sp. TRM 70361]MEE1942442.1 hypothetical protein [Streptomyces sp. TRM 70361]